MIFSLFLMPYIEESEMGRKLGNILIKEYGLNSNLHQLLSVLSMLVLCYGAASANKQDGEGVACPAGKTAIEAELLVLKVLSR